MDSQRTSHVLLVIIAVGIFFMIYLFMKERYFRDPGVQPIVWEETVPAKPRTTSTSNPVTNSSAMNPSKLSPTIGDISKGDSMQLNYGLYEKTLVFCEKYKGSSGSWIFAETISDCEDLDKTYEVWVNNFNAILKNGIDLELVDNLNNMYDVEITVSAPLDNGTRNLVLMINQGSQNNSIALARIYFESGYFNQITTVGKTYRGN